MVYPIEYDEAYSTEWRQLDAHLDRLRNYVDSSTEIIFQAGPDSICIPPSREMLSIQPKTVETVKKLLSDYMAGYVKIYKEVSSTFLDEAYEGIITNIDKIDAGNLLSRDYDYLLRIGANVEAKLSDPVSVAKTLLIGAIQGDSDYYKRMAHIRLEILQKKGVFDNQMFRVLSKMLSSLGVSSSHMHMRTGVENVYKNMIMPVVRRITRDSMLNIKNLHIVDNNSTFTFGLRPIKEFSNYIQFRTAILLARRIVVLSYTKQGAGSAYQEFRKLGDKYLNNDDGMFVYIVPRTVKGAVEAARNAFSDLTGVSVIDLTVEQDVSYELAKKARSEAAKKAAAARKAKAVNMQQADGAIGLIAPEEASRKGSYKGFLCAFGCFPVFDGVPETKLNIDFDRLRYNNIRIEKPKWIADMPTRKGRRMHTLGMMHGFNTAETALLMCHFGADGAFATTANQRVKAKELGAVELLDYVVDWIYDFVTQNKEKILFNKSLNIGVELFKGTKYEGIFDVDSRILYRTLATNQFFRSHFGIPRADAACSTAWTDVRALFDVVCHHHMDVVNQEKWKELRTMLVGLMDPDPHPSLVRLVRNINKLEHKHVIRDCAQRKNSTYSGQRSLFELYTHLSK
ncbi:MAG: hypothetical protein ACK5LG_22090 [Bacteroides thetaiotaomicron]